MTIAETIYLLCAVTSSLAAVFMYRQHRTRPSPILFWSCIGFIGLAVNNVFVYLDLGLFPAVDLVLPRTIAGTVAMVALLYGFIRSSGP